MAERVVEWFLDGKLAEPCLLGCRASATRNRLRQVTAASSSVDETLDSADGRTM